MLRNVYLVVGSTGEYSDHTTWSICAYPELALARQHAELAQKEAARLIAGCDDGDIWSLPDKPNVFDPDMRVYAGDVKYGVETVGLYLHVDDYQERT